MHDLSYKASCFNKESYHRWAHRQSLNTPWTLGISYTHVSTDNQNSVFTNKTRREQTEKRKTLSKCPLGRDDIIEQQIPMLLLAVTLHCEEITTVFKVSEMYCG